VGMFDDEPIEPITGPIDPANPPVFPGKLPWSVTTPLSDQLQKMMTEVSPYLGPDHRVISALFAAVDELTAVTFPKANRWVEMSADDE